MQSNHKDLGNILYILAEKVSLDKPYTRFYMELLMCPQALDSARDQFAINTQEDRVLKNFEFTGDRT